jgi:hypothetical protein
MKIIKLFLSLLIVFAAVSAIFGSSNTKSGPAISQNVDNSKDDCANEYDRCRTVEDFIAYSNLFKSMRDQCQQASFREAAEYAEKDYKQATGKVEFGPNSFEEIVIMPGQTWTDIVLEGGFVAKDEKIHLENKNGSMVPAGAVCLFNTETFTVEMFTIRYD